MTARLAATSAFDSWRRRNLYYDFRELTPVGPDGDEMVRLLADRLVAVDLIRGLVVALALRGDAAPRGHFGIAVESGVTERLGRLIEATHAEEGDAAHGKESPVLEKCRVHVGGVGENARGLVPQAVAHVEAGQAEAALGPLAGRRNTDPVLDFLDGVGERLTGPPRPLRKAEEDVGRAPAGRLGVRLARAATEHGSVRDGGKEQPVLGGNGDAVGERDDAHAVVAALHYHALRCFEHPELCEVVLSGHRRPQRMNRHHVQHVAYFGVANLHHRTRVRDRQDQDLPEVGHVLADDGDGCGRYQHGVRQVDALARVRLEDRGVQAFIDAEAERARPLHRNALG